MADFSAELNKLKKEVLIDIITKGCVPAGVTVSGDLSDMISRIVRVEEVTKPTKGPEHNLSKDIQVVQLEAEIKVLKVELKCSQTIIAGLSKTICDKEEIINLLKQGAPFQSKRSRAEKEGNVARPSKYSERVGIDQPPAGHRDERQAVVDVSLPRRTQTEQSRGGSPAIVGNGGTGVLPGGGFLGAARKAWLYVGRVDKGASEQHVMRHLTAKFPNMEFTVVALPVRDDAESIAFKVGADLSLFDELTKPDVWPSGVVVRSFRFFPRRVGRFKSPDLHTEEE